MNTKELPSPPDQPVEPPTQQQDPISPKEKPPEISPKEKPRQGQPGGGSKKEWTRESEEM